MQLYIDINTPNAVWDTVRLEVEHYLTGHPEHYSGFSQIYCFGATDPMKLSMQVIVEYSFTGGTLQPAVTCMTTVAGFAACAPAA